MKHFHESRHHGGVSILGMALGVMVGVITGCSGTTFTSSGSQKAKLADGTGDNGSNTNERRNSNDKEDAREDSGGTSKDESSGQADEIAGSPMETESVEVPNSDVDLGGSGKGLGLNKECLSKKAGEYNIVIVVDTSTSQKDTDPNQLRVKAGTAFIKDLALYAKAQPEISVEVGIVGFAGTSRLGAHGPLDVGKVGPEGLSADLVALNATLSSGTNYEAGLNNAATLLTQMGAKKGTANQRNFVIFMSDGEPNTSTTTPTRQSTTIPLALKQAIISNVNKMVSNFDSAMVTIASGTQISQAGIEVLGSMALPTIGNPNAEHVGKFVRVDSEAAFESLSKTLGTAISECIKK